MCPIYAFALFESTRERAVAELEGWFGWVLRGRPSLGRHVGTIGSVRVVYAFRVA